MSWKIFLLQVFISVLYFTSLLAQEGEYKFSNKDADYLIVNDKKSWEDAKKFCKDKKQMQLVSFETQAKMVKFIIYLYKRAFLQSENVHPKSSVVFAYWTSGNNLENPNKFIWDTVKMPVEYFHWLNKHEEVPGGKGCILMGLKTFGRWTNASCDMPNLFICEKPH
ncbi:C-type lectin APL-like [Bactrocera tryoni]|uniref:C-type lectin APL-like n=1 Tax=Bactrocera tryoni TaxID=59916 RepID=UPI001A97C40F|nr:C-type lectin APL-like [Bactrocera tryoni]